MTQNKFIIPALEALRDKNYLLLVATGNIYTDELRKNYNIPNIIIEDFIDFDFMLDYADLYIINGGYGGVMLSLSKGIPILTAGITEGKNDINARIRYYKVGIDLKTEKPAPDKIRITTEEMLAKKIFKNNASRMQSLLRNYYTNQIIENYVMDKNENKDRNSG